MATDITPGAPADQPAGAQPSQAKQASAQVGRQPSSRQTASGWATYHRGAVALPWLQERVCASQRFQPGASRLGRRKPRGEQTKRRQQMCRLPSSFSLTAGKGGNPDSDVVRLRHCGDERMESRVSLVIRHRCEGGKNTSENDTGSKQNCGENLKTSICKQQLLCLGLMMTSICSKCVTIKSSQQNI